MLEEAIVTGASRKAGIDKGIRNELNRLINNKGTRKFLSKSDIDAIRKVTDGDFKQNFASMVGGMGIKFENSPSVFSAMVSGRRVRRNSRFSWYEWSGTTSCHYCCNSRYDIKTNSE